MYITSALRWLTFLNTGGVYTDVSAGTGGGTPGGGAPGGGAPGGGGGGTGEPTYVTLKDDTHVDFGDGRRGKWGEIRDQQYMPRDRYEAGVKLLSTEAERLEKAWTDFHAGKREQPPAKPDPAKGRRDAYGRIAGMPIVDGRTIADMATRLEEEGFAPMAQAITAMANRLTQAENQLKAFGGTTQALATHRQNENFNQWIGNDVLGKLEGVKGVPEGVSLPTDHPILRELVQDVFLSHERDSFKSSKDVQNLVKARLEGMIALVRQLDKAGVDEGQKRKRAAFVDMTKGRANPTGDRKYKFEKPDQLASRLFQLESTGRT